MAAVKTITEQVYDNIYELILNRTFSPGMKLTLKTLQEELGVSSSPIREACYEVTVVKRRLQESFISRHVTFVFS